MAEEEDILVPRSENLIGKDMITISLPSDGSRYVVHSAILYRNARYNWPIDRLGTSVLHGVEAKTFELYLHYLYTGKIACKRDEDEQWCYSDQDHILVDLYILAEKIQDFDAKHAVMRAFISDFKTIDNTGAPGTGILQYAWDHLEEDEPLLKLMFDMYIWDSGSDHLYEGFDGIIIIKILQTALKKLERGEIRSHGSESISCCDYDQLENGMQCGSKKRKRSQTEE